MSTVYNYTSPSPLKTRTVLKGIDNTTIILEIEWILPIIEQEGNLKIS